ncbi:MAG: hypothetical protein N2Z76_03935 [Treponemataceae bacterium]|nr:hypothetical protein [Treponemataceae bacterium]
MKDFLKGHVSLFMRRRRVWKSMRVVCIVTILLSFETCKKSESDGTFIQNVVPKKTLRDFFVNRPEPRCFSYGTRLENRVPLLRSLEFVSSPFDLANRGLPVAYGYGDRYEVRDQKILEVYPLVNAPLEDVSVPAASSDTLLPSNPSDQALTEALPPVESLVYEATPRFRWESPYRITAGPLVFADTILLWTARPACVLLDRLSGRLVKEVTLSYYVAGFESFTENLGELLLIHGDQTLGYYTLKETPPEENPQKMEMFFAEILGPTEEARRKIEQKVGALLSQEPISLSRTYLFPIRDDPSPLGPRLFRWDCPEGGRYILSVEPSKGGKIFPCMMALFNGAGEFLSSNLEYEAASRFEFSRGGPELLYFVVAFLDFPEERSEAENTLGSNEKSILETSSSREEIEKRVRIVLRKK